MKNYKFTCPKCKHNELGSVEQVIMTYSITEITDEDVVVNGGVKVYHLAGQKCTTHSLIAETASAVNIQF